ncbi:MAG TPA: hypothetical protein VKZ18_09590 [Polyangia bacterium]|nr:hypothetical protein [Polyangia bacterium]
MAISSKAEAIYSRTSVPFAWKYSPNLESTTSTQDDGVSPFITLPFAFPFQDDTFTQLRISSNGFVTFTKDGSFPCGGCYAPTSFGPSGTTVAPDYTLAPWWADWNPAQDGDIYYGPVDDAFVVEWWYLSPYGAPAGQDYAFSLQLFPDGRFRFLYMAVNGGFASRDYGNTASIGYQGRSSAAFGDSTLYTGGSGGNLSNNLAYEFNRASDNLNNALFNRDNNVPDIVERWAPVIWADIDQGQNRCDQLTYPGFDGDLNGANNMSDAAPGSGFSMPAAVQYAVIYGASHTFIGYYFYHAFDCTPGIGEGHEHDWEGVTIAVNNSTGALDAVLTNTHGKEIPYHSPFDSSMLNLPHYTDSTDSPTFSYFSVRGSQGAYDTLGVGVEADTHATWGRWHNKCVIGPSGSPSGCDDGHGGDGVVYVYGGVSDTVGTINQYPNWYRSSPVRYTLRPLTDLYGYALQSSYCGQSGATALYACQSAGRPWDLMNSAGDDAADLPWVWGEYGVVPTTCQGRNVIMQPGYIFSRYFEWPAGRLNACAYNSNTFATMTTNAGVCTPQASCLGEIGPVSEESWKQSATCAQNNTGITAARCAGSYCDDMYITCAATPGGFASSTSSGFWTGFFSDENPAKFCSPDGTSNNINGIVDGIQATGSYADNISVHCAAITSGHLSNCQWTGWFSEEQGSKDFGGKFAVGAQCSGSYCDNMNYYVCNLGP